MYYITGYQSPIGALTLASDGAHLVGLWIEGQKYFASTISGMVEKQADLPVLTLTKTWLDCYFAGERPTLSAIPLAPAGSVFRQAVWKILCEIPYGTVTTYGAIAKLIAEMQGKAHFSGQAVGSAVGHNPISIIIPCHRVIGANGSLTGYAGGLSTKIKLLELEGVDLSRLFVPRKKSTIE